MIVVITTAALLLLNTFNYCSSSFLLITPSILSFYNSNQQRQQRHRITVYHYYAARTKQQLKAPSQYYSFLSSSAAAAAALPTTCCFATPTSAAAAAAAPEFLNNVDYNQTDYDLDNYRAFDLLLARKIRKSCCGKDNDVDKCLQLLLEAETPLQHRQQYFFYEESFLVALDVCSKAKRYDLAIDLYKKHCLQSERCLTKTISICGKYGQHKLAIELLFNYTTSSQQQPTTTAATSSSSSYNAAIAACAKSSASGWEDAVLVFNRLMEIQQSRPNVTITTLTCNAVLTAMSNAGRGDEALQMLQKMISSPPSLQQQLPKPDRLSFHKTMTALIKNQRLEEAYQLLGTMIKKIGKRSNTSAGDDENDDDTTRASQQLLPNNQTYDILSSAYGKAHNWTMVRKLEKLRYLPYYGYSSCEAFWENGLNSGGNDSISVVPAVIDHRQPPLIYARWDHPAFIKRGTGKFAYWEIGTYECNGTDSKCSMTVALQPNRNPRKNGMKILLMDDQVGNNSKKIGFLLMINTSVKDNKPNNYSQLLGMYLDEKYRKRGLSKVILAIWLDMCCRANLEPITGVINKPLLALVLQNTFGFVPTDHGYSQPQGVDVEINRGEDGAVELYSSSCKNLQGAFAAWDMKKENIRLMSTNKDFQHSKEEKQGCSSNRSCRVGAALELGPTVKDDPESVVQRLLKGTDASDGRLFYNSYDIDWTKIMIGY